MTLETWGVFAFAYNQFQREARRWGDALKGKDADLAAIVRGYLETGDRLVKVLEDGGEMSASLSMYQSRTRHLRKALDEGQFVTSTSRSMNLVVELGMAMHQLAVEVVAFVKANDPR